ncbi:MAG TPA: MBL fold metallo-hydrolase [Candidatus Baltobacteraceae bacterium]|nr:MBL fold metallo-hydrolase [Candidatus Baltobacteraceae bacterium]
MAELTFVGAAGTVTGSKHLLHVGGRNLFVDCGLFQGVVDVRALNDLPLPVPAKQIDAVVITHGHLDHIGYLPKLVHDGFTGPIYCTPPTKGLMQIVLDDSAHLQQELHERGFHHERPHATPPYYDEEDVAATMRLVRTMPLGKTFDLLGAASGTYHNAGHIIGSAFAALEADGHRIVFSGDLGRYGRPLLFDPDPIGAADTIVSESTYGDRIHPPDPSGELHAALTAGIARGGPIVIPAFAVERSQDILLAIAQIQQIDAEIAKLPIFLDSPMASKVDDLFEAYPDAHKPIPRDRAGAPFGVQNFTVCITTEASKRLNALDRPAVIISASGMAAGGRILHHLHNRLSDRTATVIFAGYQSVGTLGYLLIHGAHTIRIFGDSLPIEANIVHLSGFSAHADQNDLKRWFGTCTTTPHLYAVHGEVESATAVATLAANAFGWPAEVARRGTTVPV